MLISHFLLFLLLVVGNVNGQTLFTAVNTAHEIDGVPVAGDDESAAVIAADSPLARADSWSYKEPRFYKFYERSIDGLQRCPRKREPPVNGTKCGGVAGLSKTCLWGKQTCEPASPGGRIHPQTRCDCRNKSWTCQNFTCPDMNHFCPIEDPSILQPTPICSGDPTCIYGEEVEVCNGRKLQKTRYVDLAISKLSDDAILSPLGIIHPDAPATLDRNWSASRLYVISVMDLSKPTKTLARLTTNLFSTL